MEALLFDASAYHHAPALSVSTAITLIDSLVLVCPKGAPALAKKKIKHLQALKERLTGELSSRRQARGKAPARPAQEIDQVADRAWRSVRRFCEAYLDLQPAFAPHQAAVRELDELLFGDGGLAFTTVAYPEQKTEMHHRLDILAEGDHLTVLRAVAGEGCEKNLRAAVKDYDQMVQGLLQEVGNDEAKLLPVVRDIQQSVVDYARYLSATVDEEDAETVLAARRALAPIDNLRRLTSTPRSTVVKDTPPTPPTPPGPS